MLGLYCKGSPVSFYSVSTPPNHHLIPTCCGVGIYFEDVHPEWWMCCKDIPLAVRETWEKSGRLKGNRLFKKAEDQQHFDCLFLSSHDIESLEMYVNERKGCTESPHSSRPSVFLVELMILFMKNHPGETLFPFIGECPASDGNMEAILNGSLWRAMGNIAVAIP
ncbi:hypothetical protein [Paenibacillus sp. YYML68]|uniref:hypothetical protein n=1 Tax=Paenibacillus sp. YYML68 TaxID=2909250 RepID=UPI0024935BE2|nr:hypothetical protein [Paenibacillus sp. YYML68]